MELLKKQIIALVEKTSDESTLKFIYAFLKRRM